MNYPDIDSLYIDAPYTTSTQGGNWTWTTSTTSTTTSPGQPLWGPNGIVGPGTSAPSSDFTFRENNLRTLMVGDVQIQDLGSVKELLQNLPFLTPPLGLDTDNPTVMDALKTWYQAVQELRQRHEQLQMLIKITDESR